MNTKLKALAASCALIAAGQAHALPATTVPAVQLFISGSSALNVDLVNEVAGTLCTAGTYDMFLDNGGGGDQRLIVCTGSASAGTAASGQPLAVYIRSNGGSYYGTSPVGTTVIKRYDATANAGCGASGSNVTIGATITGGSKCTGWVAAAPAGVLVSQIPDVGISDEEPALFANANNVPTAATCTTGPFADAACPPSASNYVSSSAIVQAMGIVVTNQLQSALIAAGSGTVGGRASMSSPWVTQAFAQTSGVYSAAGGNGDWAGLSNLVTAATGVTAAAFTGVVKICRRAAGSGTQAALQAKFFGIGCTGQTPVPSSASDSYDPGTGATYSVVENSSSGAVKTCMDTAFSAGTKAIGILSLDQGPLPSARYDFVKIDGADAVDANITNGVYNYLVESNLNIANGLSTAKSGVANGLLAAFKTVTTQSPSGVYNTNAAAAGAKTMKGTNGGVTCKAILY